jgi:hypothetical protein
VRGIGKSIIFKQPESCRQADTDIEQDGRAGVSQIPDAQQFTINFVNLLGWPTHSFLQD